MRIPLASTFAAALAFLAAPAAAQWFYDPGPLSSGQAIGMGERGLSVVVECGNGGLPAVLVKGYDPGAESDIFVWEVDSYGEQLIAAQCTGGSCLLEFDSMEMAESTVEGLRIGSLLKLGLYRRGELGNVRLNGSDTAISQVLARDCGFF
ncbi:hypothetical protein [Pseudoroseicyclus sp. CXY001]|uniref:hypothetical protein n=1 Tax=Pseudoroseicyclus sp. CXY001 TaxID=3242492 RepID=UPI003570B8BB